MVQTDRWTDGRIAALLDPAYGLVINASYVYMSDIKTKASCHFVVCVSH